MHYHAYSWRGPTKELGNDQYRRSENAEFRSSEVPPEMIRDWFLKPSRLIRGTWDKPDPAVAWLTDRFLEVEKQVKHPLPDWVTLEDRQQRARDDLSHGQEVVWCHYLRGETTAAFYVVGCPDRWGKNPCPTGRA